jgi:parallel beta-helix repeat protein
MDKKMRKRSFIMVTGMMLLGWALFATGAFATTHYVDLDSPTPTPPYMTWATAAHTIQEAVDQAVEGSTVLVADGRYILTSEIFVNTAILIQSANGAAGAIVDGNGVTRCIYIDNVPAVIDGFTVTGGAATSGAGIYFNKDGQVENSLITGNTATGRGGGVYCNYGGQVVNCEVSGNRAADGGGLYSYDIGSLEVMAMGSLFESNAATRNGGGVYLDYHGGTVASCIIRGNSAVNGAGAYLYYQSLINSSLIVKNTATTNGGGVMLTSTGDTICNCTVVGNSAAYGGGLYKVGSESSSGYARNSIIYYNTATELGPNWYGIPRLYYTCTIPTDAPTSIGNIEDPPQFVDQGAGDYHLLPGSPCIDTGNNADAKGDTDLDGNDRIMNGTVDMGAFEHDPGPLSCGVIPVSGTFALEPTELSATVTGSDTTGLTYYWDFDNDGTWDLIGLDAVVSHVYSNYGPVACRVMVTNAGGESATYILHLQAGPEVVYVSTNGSSVYPYTTWATAATNLQDAVDAAVDGSLIRINDGIFSVSSRVIVEKGVHIQSVNGAGATILQGDSTDRCLHVSHSQALIEGLTVTGGSATDGGGISVGLGIVKDCVITGNAAVRGGGILCGAGGEVWNSTISENTASTSGGGAYFLYGGLFKGCLIETNSAGYGAGIYFYCDGQVENSLITGNAATGSGGGVYCNDCEYGGRVVGCVLSENVARNGGGLYIYDAYHTSTVVAMDSLFDGNTATQNGGGVYLDRYCSISNCTVSNNMAVSGGGAYLDYNAAVNNSLIIGNLASQSGGGVMLTSTYDTIRNCTVVDNSAAYGGGLYQTDSNADGAYNSIIYYNTATELGPNWYGIPELRYTCTIPTDAPTSVGCIDDPPLFIDQAGGNYRLLPGSPCIDAGNNSSARGDTDLDGKPRILYDIVDMGAYEWPFMIYATAGEHGTITMSGIYWIPYGEDRTYTVTADPLYHISDLLVNGQSVGTFGMGWDIFDYTFLNVTSNQTIEAFFNIDWYIVQVTAEGGTVTGAGQYDHGAQVVLTATADDGYTFLNWTEGGQVVSTNPQYTFEATRDRILAANFQINQYVISVSANPAEGGTVTGGGQYDHGTQVILRATANAGYSFLNWTEDGQVASTTPEYTFSATSERTLAANFQLNQYIVVASASPLEGGTVTGGGTYGHGTQVTLRATANEGYSFVDWSEGGQVVCTSEVYSFTAEGDRTLVANFQLNQYTIAVSANPAEGGIVTGGGMYDHGSQVTLRATPNAGYSFVNWTEGGQVVSTSEEYSFTAEGDRTLMAIFSPDLTPVIDIKANGSDGPVTVSQGATVSITIALDPREYAGFNADWWIAVHTPFAPPGDWYTYVHPTGWMPGVNLCAQTPLFDMTSFEVLDMALPVGNYTFYFAVDPPDGIPTAELLDSVEVKVQ